MRKTFSILDQYGGVLQTFKGTRISFAETNPTVVSIYDTQVFEGLEKYGERDYLKAIHCLFPGTTICHTEEPKIITSKDFIAMQEAADVELMKRKANG